MKEITGMTLSANRRYLCVHELRTADLHTHVTFYDLKQVASPKLIKSVNLSELVYGTPNKRELTEMQKEAVEPT